MRSRLAIVAPRRRGFALSATGLCLLLAAAAYAPAARAKDDYKVDPVTGTKYKADSDMQDLLEAYAGLGGKHIETLTPAEARLQPSLADAVTALMQRRGMETDPGKLVGDVTTTEVTIPGETVETPLTARVYSPVGPGPFPAILFLHGGGWVLGSSKTDDLGARYLAKNANAVVISLNYRLAPEHPFPAAWDDALDAYKWMSGNVVNWRGDPRRLAIAGESAGGTLALATAIATADAGLTRPKAVVAIYPFAQTGTETQSYVDCANAKVLNEAMIAWFMHYTLASPAQKTDPRIDLLHAKLSLLPPVTLINAQIDPLRSDGDMLEEALKQAGVTVVHKEFEGVTHGFFDASPVLGAARGAESFAADQLKIAFQP